MRVLAFLLALAGFAFWAFGNGSTQAADAERGVVTYFTNGQLKTQTSYHDGRRHGPYRSFYADGKPRLAGEYEDGRREGAWTAWTPDGSRDEELCGTYRAGRRVGG